MTTQRVDVQLIVDYPGIGTVVSKSALAGKPVQKLRPAITANVALVWSQVAVIAPGLLSPGKYAVRAVTIYGATTKAFRLVHGEFMGLTPGGPCGSVVGHKKNRFDFSDFDSCPVFDAGSNLGIETLAVTTDTAVVSIEVVKMQ